MPPKSLLITAFEPFGIWPTNSSALCLGELLPQLPSELEVCTRIYPVDFAEVRLLLEADLNRGFDFAIHLGQAQQTGRIRLESVAINLGAVPGQPAEQVSRLSAEGPVGYQSALPLAAWVRQLQAAGIPAYVSYHAGTYLCNATLYWSHLLIAQNQLPTRACFVHLPLDVSQVVSQAADWHTLPAATSAKAVRLIIESLLADSPAS